MDTREGAIKEIKKYGCYNRPVADMFKGCKPGCAYTVEKPDDPRCGGCIWNLEARGVKAMSADDEEGIKVKVDLDTTTNEMPSYTITEEEKSCIKLKDT